jgi:hypothetical protein
LIASKDRSGWIGASDTAMVMANWHTPTWHKWWATKLGITSNDITTTAMLAGTYYEHPILDALGIKRRDRQIRIRRLRLRVNLDGEDAIIHEVKTHGKDTFKVTKAYWQQAQVEMFATRKPLVIDAYRLTEADYQNFFLPIDPARLSRHPIEYDPAWVKNDYLPRLRILAKALRKGVYPDESHRQDP